MTKLLWLVPLVFLVGLLLELRFSGRSSEEDIQEYYADYYEQDGK